MKGRVIALGELAGREAAALIEDGRLEDLVVDGAAPRPGSIYRARIDRPAKGQGGMFVQTPDGSAFLRQVKGLSPGRPILVQVTGYAEPGKAIPVTAKILFKSRHAIVTPQAPGLNVSRQIRDEALRDALLEIAHEAMAESGGMGLILRSTCAGAEVQAIAEDIRAMADLAARVMTDEGEAPEALLEGDGPHGLAWRDWPLPDLLAEGEGAFEDHGVLDALESLRNPAAPLPGGGEMVVEPTRALVAVDINTGGDTSPAAGLKANLAAARALPRQLRLRGLGGQITIDLAPIGKKARRQFEAALRAALRREATETALVGWTPLGHYELQRKRDRVPISEVLG